MDWIIQLVNNILHLDRFLDDVIRDYHTWTYLFLFGVIFMETGLVVTPFLPGDSLLFAAGAVAARAGSPLNVLLLYLLLCVAAILGDTVNYWVGHFIGPRAFSGNIRFLKKEYLDRTHAFYEKYGGKTIILARFIPIIRTFAPFVAGIGAMSYGKFIVYNVAGGVTWVAIFTFGGYRFGSQEWVRENFIFVVLAIILISIMPLVVELIQSRRRARSSPA
jgi:membrane-associated protein